MNGRILALRSALRLVWNSDSPASDKPPSRDIRAMVKNHVKTLFLRKDAPFPSEVANAKPWLDRRSKIREEG